MTEFLQVHLLTSYPPSNLNRDDLNRPKTAVMGGANRLRVSSQSLKRSWRTSELFEEALAEHRGTRTKRIGRKVRKRLIESGMAEKKAEKAARAVAGVFGKLKKKTKKPTKESADIEQLAHFSPPELRAVDELTEKLAEEDREPSEDELDLLRKDHRAADIALFGRMLADSPGFNVEAAAQVAHAITVHEVTVEDDFFSAVDDLNPQDDDAGAGHLGQLEFGAGLFYLYFCVNRDLLSANLQGDDDLVARSLRALTEAAATISPTGKQNSFASRAYASYIVAEKGRSQPRSLSVAFVRPVGHRRRDDGYVEMAVEALEETLERMDACYGTTAEARVRLDTTSGEGTLDDVLDFVATPLG